MRRADGPPEDTTMRTAMTATMMLMASVMMARAAGAGPAVHNGLRTAPSPVSTYSVLGLTQDVRALSIVENVRIEQLPGMDVHDRVATVQFLVEPRVLANFTYRAQLSINGEPVSERRIAPGSFVTLEAPLPVDGEIHATCVSVQRMSDAGGASQAARRCFDVTVGTRQY
jgi:hypothetical protein